MTRSVTKLILVTSSLDYVPQQLGGNHPECLSTPKPLSAGPLGSSLGPHSKIFLLRSMFCSKLPKIEVHTLRLRNEFMVKEA